MQTISGAIGMLNPSPFPAAVTPPGHPTFTLLQFTSTSAPPPPSRSEGMLASLLYWVMPAAAPNVDAPTTIGIVTFLPNGLRAEWKVDGILCGQAELDCWRAHQESWWPQDQRPNLARFVAKVASQIQSVVDVQTILDSPIHLPFTGEKVLRVTALAGSEAVGGLPEEWRGLIHAGG